MLTIIHEQDDEFFDAPFDAFLVFILKGAFCPPHQGHWEIVENAMTTYPHALLIFIQCNQSRHHIPIETAKNLLQLYVQESEYRDRIFYRFDDHISNTIYHWMRTHTHRLLKPHSFVLLRGYEPMRTFTDHQYQQRFQRIARYLQKKDIGLVMIQNKRGRFSSTRFMSLIHSEKHNECLSFVPPHLSQPESILDCLRKKLLA